MANIPDTVERRDYYSSFDDAFHSLPPPLEWNFGCDKVTETYRSYCQSMGKFVGRGIAINLPTASGLEMVFWQVGEKSDLGAIFPFKPEEEKT